MNKEIKSEYKIFTEVIKYLIKVFANLGIKYFDFINALGLNEVYTKEILLKANEYSLCNPTQKKELELNLTIDELKLVEKIIANTKLLEDIQVKAIEYITNNRKEVTKITLTLGIETDNLQQILDQLIQVFYQIKINLNQANDIYSEFEKPFDGYEFIEYYNNRDKEPIDEVVDSCINTKAWNIFDLNWLENNLFTALRKDKYSIEWLQSTNLETIFLAYFNLCDRNLIQAAEYWYRDKLREIQNKLEAKDLPTYDEKDPMRERNDEEKDIYCKNLETKYFKKNKEIKEK